MTKICKFIFSVYVSSKKKNNFTQDIASKVIKHFYVLQGSEGDAAIAMATKSPQKFVLKPQREGGGKSIWDSCYQV